jgi:energy-coupling factor transport system permease protein
VFRENGTMLSPYKDVGSRIHRLDARPKMAFVAAIFLLSILISDILYLGVLLLIVLLACAVAGVLRPTLGLLRYAIFVGAFILLFNLVLSSGGTLLIKYGWVVVTLEGVTFGVSMCIRLFLAVAAFGFLSFAVHPDESMRTLSRFGFNTMTSLSLAMRMYPTIAADAKGIEDAMRARGASIDRGRAITRAKARAPVLMPLLLNSLDRTVGVAEAMEVRGFGSGKRTGYHTRAMDGREKGMLLAAFAALLLGITGFILGLGNVNYLDEVSFSYSIGDAAILGAMAVLLSTITLGADE